MNQHHFFGLTFRTFVFAGAIALMAFSSALTSAQDRGRGDRGGRDRGGRRGGGEYSAEQLKSYIRSKDRNGDGTIQPDELSDRSRSYLNGIGVNTSSNVRLDSIFKRIDKDKGVSTTSAK